MKTIKHIRVFGYKNTIWKAVPEERTNSISDTSVLNIRDAKGNKEQIFASEVSIDHIYYNK